MIDPAAGYLVAGSLALLFLSTSWHKWRLPAEFGVVLANYQLLPSGTVRVGQWLLPALETAVGLALLVPAARSLGALVGAGLLVAYGAAIAVNLHRGRLDLDCGCGPRTERVPIAGWMVLRNVALAILLVVTSVLPWTQRSLDAIDALSVIGGVAIGALLYLSIDELLGRVVPRARALRRPA